MGYGPWITPLLAIGPAGNNGSVGLDFQLTGRSYQYLPVIPVPAVVPTFYQPPTYLADSFGLGLSWLDGAGTYPITWPANALGIQTRDTRGADAPGGPAARILIRAVTPSTVDNGPNSYEIRQIVWPGSTPPPLVGGTVLATDVEPYNFVQSPTYDYSISVTQTLWIARLPLGTSAALSNNVTIVGGWLYQPPDYRFILKPLGLHQRQRVDGQGGGPPHQGRSVNTRQYGLYARGVL